MNKHKINTFIIFEIYSVVSEVKSAAGSGRCCRIGESTSEDDLMLPVDTPEGPP